MIGLYCPDVPPIPGGVSDHTLALARAIDSLGGSVAVLAHRGDPALFAPIPCFTGLLAGDVAAKAAKLGVSTIVIQYVPFLWGWRGVSPGLIRGIHRIHRAGIRIGAIVHEPFVPFTRIPWLVIGVPQRFQLWYLLHKAVQVYAPVERFVQIAHRYAANSTRVAIAPIGATIPVSPVSRDEARRRLGLAANDVAIGIFSPAASGFAHDWIAEAARKLSNTPNVVWVRFGFGSERALPGYPTGRNVITIGPAPADDISATMRAIDIAAAPYLDGLTMRRSGAMLALATGIPTVSSEGPLYDPSLGTLARCASSAQAFASAIQDLVEDPAERHRWQVNTAGYATQASMESLAAQMIRDLEDNR